MFASQWLSVADGGMCEAVPRHEPLDCIPTEQMPVLVPLAEEPDLTRVEANTIPGFGSKRDQQQHQIGHKPRSMATDLNARTKEHASSGRKLGRAILPIDVIRSPARLEFAWRGHGLFDGGTCAVASVAAEETCRQSS